MPDRVGKDDVVAIGIQKLSRPEEHTGKSFTGKLLARAARAVQNHDSIRDSPARVGDRFSVSGIVQLHLGQNVPRPEVEVVHEEITFGPLR